MTRQEKDEVEIIYKNYKQVEERFICPTKEVDEEHFIEPDLACFLYLFNWLFKPDEKNFVKIYNCVHCNGCKTSNSRYYLKRNLTKAGYVSSATNVMIKSFKQHGTPFGRSAYRLKIPSEVPEESDTLLFMGCLSTMKVPRFTLNAIRYLLSKGYHFTVLETEACCGIPLLDSGETEVLNQLVKKNTEIFNSGKYKRIICVCPACYDVFNNFYDDIEPEVVFIGDLLEPTKKKSGTISIQHLCQLQYRGRADIMNKINDILETSGYHVMEQEKHWCCGGGMGLMHIEDNIDKIARMRINDFHGDFLTTYCPSCYHILKLYSKKEKIKPKLVDTFKLLMEEE
ncbi:MAG: heterodisulfide reductase-related iron-sulfur binding cluster [Candidatus Helarchaeota archaeon]